MGRYGDRAPVGLGAGDSPPYRMASIPTDPASVADAAGRAFRP